MSDHPQNEVAAHSQHVALMDYYLDVALVDNLDAAHSLVVIVFVHCQRGALGSDAVSAS